MHVRSQPWGNAALMPFVLLLALVGGCLTANDPPPLTGSYLGMTLPGDVPEVFAPGIVSGIYREHSGAVFSPDGNELYWSTVVNQGQQPRLLVTLHMKQEDGVWSAPELAPFVSGTGTHINSISPDGRRLLFMSNRGAEGLPLGKVHVWVADKTDIGWGEPYLSEDLNRPETHLTDVQQTRNGNLYGYGNIGSDPDWRGLLCSRLVAGEYQPLESLGPHVNSEYADHSITVDADERFIIFASQRPGGFSPQDLYISYRQADGSWGPAINLGEKINTTGDSQGWPHLSPDSSYLFFTSTCSPYDELAEKPFTWADIKEISSSVMNGWSNIYWVSTSFVDELRPAGEE